MDAATFRLLADFVLAVHFALVVFVVAGLPLIVLGNLLRWRFVNSFIFRAAHLAAIGIVVAQAWLGVVCPLTTLESWLRQQAGAAPYEASFIEHWLRRLLFYAAPTWTFTAVYTVFGLGVAAAWWYFPPGRHRQRRETK